MAGDRAGLSDEQAVVEEHFGRFASGFAGEYDGGGSLPSGRSIFAGTDFGLYYSIDSGKTWSKDYRVPNVAVHEIEMRDDRTLFVITHGRGMFALPLVYMEEPVSVSKFRRGPSIKLYPNPSSASISVRGRCRCRTAVTEFTTYRVRW